MKQRKLALKDYQWMILQGKNLTPADQNFLENPKKCLSEAPKKWNDLVRLNKLDLKAKISITKKPNLQENPCPLQFLDRPPVPDIFYKPQKHEKRVKKVHLLPNWRQRANRFNK